MGIDYSTSVLWGVEVSPPEDVDCEYEWLEDLVRGTEFRFFTCGSSWSGDVFHAVGVGRDCRTRTGGKGWVRTESIATSKQKEQLWEFLLKNDLPGVPGYLFGFLIF